MAKEPNRGYLSFSRHPLKIGFEYDFWPNDNRMGEEVNPILSLKKSAFLHYSLDKTHNCYYNVNMNKETYIMLRVTKEEKKKVTALARKLGLSVSAYIRMMIHKAKG